MGEVGFLPSPGDLVAGRYRVERPLGEGGMAVVYRARHEGTEKPCALKVLRPALAERADLIQQFVREARVSGRIGDHPNIVDVFDVGVDAASGLPFIAMELLIGQSLRRYINKHAPVAWPVARPMLAQLGEALDEAHRAGVIHRDLKPGNVFVTSTRSGQVAIKVLDFGIAKLLDSSTERTATEVGTPWYNAPEQLGTSMRTLAAERGITIAVGVCAQTDVWALGFLAYELLTGCQTGQYWAAASVADQMFKVVLGERELPSVKAGERARFLPPGFDEWFLRCTRHNAAERWLSAGQAMGDLCRLIDHALQAGPPPDPSGFVPAPTASGAGQPWSQPAMTPASLPSAPAQGLPGMPPAPGPAWTGPAQPAYPTPAAAAPAPAAMAARPSVEHPATPLPPVGGMTGPWPAGAQPPTPSPPEPSSGPAAQPLSATGPHGEAPTPFPTGQPWQWQTAGAPARRRPHFALGLVIGGMLVVGGLMVFLVIGRAPASGQERGPGNASEPSARVEPQPVSSDGGAESLAPEPSPSASPEPSAPAAVAPTATAPTEAAGPRPPSTAPVRPPATATRAPGKDVKPQPTADPFGRSQK